MRITYDEDGKPTAHLDNANVNDSDIEKILYGNARSSDNFSTRKLMNELKREVRKTKDDYKERLHSTISLCFSCFALGFSIAILLMTLMSR